MARQKTIGKSVESLNHAEATRKNIPTAEHQSIMHEADKSPIQVAYERRNRDLDPQLVWRGKDEQDWSDLVVQAPPLYIQEKVHPKVLIDDLLRRTKIETKADEAQFDLFADFNGLPSEAAKTEFYQHDAHWANRMILGDSLQVMASLAEREGLRGKVQCIYFDPPYGIKFNSNFQWSTTSRDVKDGKADHITREPEQVKAFRDTWRDGIHSYLTYLRDRLTVARDLLSDSGSIFVQIGDENVHLVKSLLDEIFGAENFVSIIAFTKTSGLGSTRQLAGRFDLILWCAKSANSCKYRSLYEMQEDFEKAGYTRDDPDRPDAGPYMSADLTKPGPGQKYEVDYFGRKFIPGRRWWGYPPESIVRMYRANRLEPTKSTIRFKKFYNDYPLTTINNLWLGFGGAKNPQYVVETNEAIVQRCVLMTTDPGDLVLDPTCGSGTTAYVAEQWGRRWMTIDTSRVSLALARARIMGARYPYYLLADSPEGQQKEAEITRTMPSTQPTTGNIRHGFVYERVPHITLKSIANNTEIDVIWDRFQEKLEPLRLRLNSEVGRVKGEKGKEPWEEWEIPREEDAKWSDAAKKLHANWWAQRIARQKEIDASIAAKAEHEYLYDKPYEDKKKVRVAGPFTVESLSPHRVLTVGADDELIDTVAEAKDGYGQERDFVQMILENLKTAGVQQAHKEDKLNFTALTPWPGDLICADARYEMKNEVGREKGENASDFHSSSFTLPSSASLRAGIFIGPEFGTRTWFQPQERPQMPVSTC